MKYIFSVICLLYFSCLQAQNVNLVWAKQIGAALGEYCQSVAVDASGNVYTTGFFEGTVDFDPGAGTVSLTAAGLFDVYVSKLDAAGMFVWAKRIGGVSADVESSSIAIDASGNIYTTGVFAGTADFDPGAPTVNLSSAVNGAIFISKLDAFGNFIWAKNFGGALKSSGASIAVDASGNVHTTGYFEGTADFDPGVGTFNLTSAGSDIFISKLDVLGNFVWAKNIGGGGGFNEGNGLAVDVLGNVYTTGDFEGTADFDPGAGTFNITSNGLADIFVSKLDVSGNFVWAKNMGGNSDDFGFSIAINATGNVHTTGQFSGTADFDPGAGTVNLVSAGSNDIFISKLNSSGDFVWAKNLGGNFNDVGISIVSDASGDVYTTGTFLGTADFDPGSGSFNLTSAGMEDIFISKLNAAGNFVWAINMGGTNTDYGISIAVDASGNVYNTGYFYGTADFDPGAGTVLFTSAGFSDIFILKFSQAAVIPVTVTDAKAFQKNAGVQVEWTTQQEINIERYEVERSQNGQQFTKLGTVSARGNSAATNYTFFDPSPFKGLSFYRIKIIDAGHVTYSHVFKVNIGNSLENMITIYPNPINGNSIDLQINLEKGIYTISLTNKFGQQLATKRINHSGGSATENLKPSKPLAAGVYQLNITGEETNIIKQVIKY